MINKRSRYYRLDETTFPDQNGIERQCKALRRLRGADGQFLHNLEASDRLDHLAYKYYQQSLHWWRICDANLKFDTPLALLDKTPDTKIEVELAWDDTQPPLALLYDALKALTGIKQVDKGKNNGIPKNTARPHKRLLPGCVRKVLISCSTKSRKKNIRISPSKNILVDKIRKKPPRPLASSRPRANA